MVLGRFFSFLWRQLALFNKGLLFEVLFLSHVKILFSFIAQSKIVSIIHRSQLKAKFFWCQPHLLFIAYDCAPSLYLFSKSFSTKCLKLMMCLIIMPYASYLFSKEKISKQYPFFQQLAVRPELKTPCSVQFLVSGSSSEKEKINNKAWPRYEDEGLSPIN